MISTASEYEYVCGYNVDSLHPHGDLDRIILTGEIDPTLEENATPLRGELVTFLMEAVAERQDIRQTYHNLNPILFAFSRIVMGNHGTGLTGRYDLHSAAEYLVNNLFGGSTYLKWLNEETSERLLVNHYGLTSNDSAREVFASASLTSTDATADPDDFRIYRSAQRLDPFRKAFADLLRLNFFWCQFDWSVLTPALSSFVYDDYVVNGTVDTYTKTTFANQCYIYFHDLSGQWRLNGEEEQLVIFDSFDAYLRNLALTLPSGIFKFAKAVDLWANLEIKDYDNTRSTATSDVTSRAMMKLQTITPQSISSTGLVFPSKYLTDCCATLLSESAEAHSTGLWNTPFVIRTPGTYKSNEKNSFYHTITIRLINLFPVCELRDRTRFQTS